MSVEEYKNGCKTQLYDCTALFPAGRASFASPRGKMQETRNDVTFQAFQQCSWNFKDGKRPASRGLWEQTTETYKAKVSW